MKIVEINIEKLGFDQLPTLVFKDESGVEWVCDESHLINMRNALIKKDEHWNFGKNQNKFANKKK